MNNQEAKSDAGKMHPSYVPVELIETAVALREYEIKAAQRKVPQVIRKLDIKDKALFECPYCGKEFEAWISNVLRGRQHSCGCMKGKFLVESNNTHGESKTRLYRTYRHILERCNDEKCKEYRWYGARGIKCEFESYEQFRDFALSHGYTDELTCERVDVDGNYSPDNVIFIPAALQARNRQSSVRIEYKGVTMCAAEWAELLGMKQDTLTSRIRKGWSAEKALETKVEGTDMIDISLIPVAALKAIHETRIYGLKKYNSPDNWRSVEFERYHEAFLRHVLAMWNDPYKKDFESGLPHMWHAMCNAAFMREMMEGNHETPDI